MFIRSHLLASAALGFPMIGFDSEGEGGGGGGSPSVEHLSGGVTRVTPSGDPEEQARKEAQAAGGTAPELKEGEGEEQQLPEGYESWEAYGKDVAAGKVQAPEAKVAEGEEEPKAQEGEEEKPTELQTKIEPFEKEFQETGTLSDESVTKAAEAFGVTEDMVRQYIEGGTLAAQAAVAPFHEQTGGAEQYRAFQEWSVEGMTEAEQKELNEAYAQGGSAALALQQKFVDRWKEQGGGPPPKDLTREGDPGKGSSAAGDAYESWEQVKADMRKPEYDRDPAFRQKVQDKIARSTI